MSLLISNAARSGVVVAPLSYNLSATDRVVVGTLTAVRSRATVQPSELPVCPEQAPVSDPVTFVAGTLKVEEILKGQLNDVTAVSVVFHDDRTACASTVGQRAIWLLSRDNFKKSEPTSPGSDLMRSRLPDDGLWASCLPVESLEEVRKLIRDLEENPSLPFREPWPMH